MRPGCRLPICAASTGSATPRLQLEGPLRRDGCLQARRLKALEDENTRLKRLLADAMLDNAALKDAAPEANCLRIPT
ncbi:hypothetical protein X737_39700 [Mesorhizobium sp. L48C026A00]|nr:hypothetical protein X737_39700 [Mesorhizobium sp. L48C026A00]